jgi:hypothetical protein
MGREVRSGVFTWRERLSEGIPVVMSVKLQVVVGHSEGAYLFSVPDGSIVKVGPGEKSLTMEEVPGKLPLVLFSQSSGGKVPFTFAPGAGTTVLGRGMIGRPGPEEIFSRGGLGPS